MWSIDEVIHRRFDPTNKRAMHFFAHTILKGAPEALVDGIYDGRVNLSVGEAASVLGFEVEGVEKPNIDAMLDLDSLGKLDRSTDVFYFDNPRHPVLRKARVSKNHVTSSDFTESGEVIGMNSSAAARSYGKLLVALSRNGTVNFSDERSQGFVNDSWVVTGRNIFHERYSVRMRVAKAVLHSELEGVDVSGNVVSLLNAVVYPEELTARDEFLAGFEELSREDVFPLESKDNSATHFSIGDSRYHGYRDVDISMSANDRYTLSQFLREAAIDVGMIEEGEMEDRTSWLSHRLAELLMSQLCDYGKDHKNSHKQGIPCNNLHTSALRGKHRLAIAEAFRLLNH